jgi:diamine N-acetyltransferase
MNQFYTFEQVKLAEIAIIKELWEELNQLHLSDTVYFQEHYKNFAFEKRASKFKKKDDRDVFIEIVRDSQKIPVGYCISTVDEDTGEIDSICINHFHRKKGLGEKLIQNAILWLKSKNCKTIKLAVSYGHEVVFEFYKKLGFYPRMTYLELKE